MARIARTVDDCPNEHAATTLKRLGGRWKICLVRRLLAGPAGFAELRRAMPRISPKVLAEQLRELERDGVVRRQELVATPPKTTLYTLTALGAALGPVVDAMTDWGRLARAVSPPGARPDASSRLDAGPAA